MPTSSKQRGRFTFKLVEKTPLAPGIIRLILEPDGGPLFSYMEGQFISLCLPDGQTRCYSMANADIGTGRIELHIKVYSGGLFSEQILRTLSVGARLWADGPYGACVLSSGSTPILMMGTGTGIAPLKAIVERLALTGHQADVYVYWGVQTREALYLSDYFALQITQLPGLRFVPVLSADHLPGFRHGRVQDAALADFPDLTGMRVYACGAPAMVEDARARMACRGLDASRFYADPFDQPQGGRLPFCYRKLQPSPLEVGIERISVTVQTPDGKTDHVSMPVGQSALQGMRQAGVPVLAVCGGKRSCGTCRLRLKSTSVHQFSARSRDEKLLLAVLDDPSPEDRLACQLVVTVELEGSTLILAP